MIMTHAEDQNPTPSPTENAAAADKGAKPSQPVPGKDPNEYDPVGMAGKKAGILQEPGEEDNQALKEEQNARHTKGHGALPGAHDKKD